MKRVSFHLFVGALLLGLALVGIGTKLYRGTFEAWFHNYAGGVVYEIFWIVLFGALWSKVKPWRIALAVFVVTCALEFLQLYRSPFLAVIRSNFLGRALIGNGFDPWDFLYYVVGSILGWVTWRGIRQHAHRSGLAQTRAT